MLVMLALQGFAGEMIGYERQGLLPDYTLINMSAGIVYVMRAIQRALDLQENGNF